MVGERHDLTDSDGGFALYALLTRRQRMELETHRWVVSCIFQIPYAGIPCQGLPERDGLYTVHCNRYSRWSRNRIRWRIEKCPQEIADRVDDGDKDSDSTLRTRMVDASPVCENRRSARDHTVHKECTQLGRSQGRFGSIIHTFVDGNRQPGAPGQSSGQAADCAQAEAPGFRISLLSDQANGTNAILEPVARAGATNVLESRPTRAEPRSLDLKACAMRERIERFFGIVKRFRRVATRYDPRDRAFRSALFVAPTWYQLRELAAPNN